MASTLTAAVLRSELGLLVVKVVQFSWLSKSSNFVEAFEGHVLLGPSQSHDEINTCICSSSDLHKCIQFRELFRQLVYCTYIGNFYSDF